MQVQNIFNILKVNKPIDVLKEVIHYNNQKANANKSVLVKSILSSGTIIEGYPIKMDTDKSIIIATQESNNLLFVDANTIIAVEIINPKAILSVLTNGQYFEIEKAEILSNLEVKRNFKKTQDLIKNKYDVLLNSKLIETTLSDKTKYQFNQFLLILTNSLKQTVKDKLGKKALQNIEALEIKKGNKEIQITKNKDKLVFSINFDVKFSANFEQKTTTLIEGII